MKRSKTGIETKKSSRRRSWLNNNPLFNIFTSAPSSPERRSSTELTRHRSHSLTPIDSPTTPPPVRPAPLKSSKSTLSSILSKASSKKKKKQHARKESSQTTYTFTDYSSIHGSFCSSNRRSSNKSDATVVSDMDPYLMHDRYHQKSKPNSMQDGIGHQQQLIKSDEEEADRIQLKNDLVKLAFEGEFSLPFDYQKMKGGRVLDIGCGPGSWCIDLSTTYPNIHVVGVDSEDMFPCKHSLPSNCELIVCNVLNGLKEFPDASFDVIHIRFMVLAFTTRQYYQVVKDCWRLLKPKGYLEIFETDLTVYSAGPVTQKLNEEMFDVAISRGINPRELVNDLKHLVPSSSKSTTSTEDNLIHQQIKYRSIPIGVWGGRIGVLCRDDIVNILTKFQPAIRNFYGRSNYEQHAFERDVLAASREMEQYKSFTNYYSYTAQKPEIIEPIIRRQYTPPTFNPKSI